MFVCALNTEHFSLYEKRAVELCDRRRIRSDYHKYNDNRDDDLELDDNHDDADDGHGEADINE